MATKKGTLSLPLIAAALVAAPALAANHPEALRTRVAAQRVQLGLDADHDFSVRNSHVDSLGQTHARLQQTYRGVKVFGGEVIAHQDKQGAALPSTLGHMKGINLNVNASLTPTEALAIAHQDLAPRGAYAYQPTAELVIVPEMVETMRPGARKIDGEFNGADAIRQVVRYTLAYRVNVEIENADETIHRQYLINAHTGAVIKSWDNLHTAGVNGTGKSQYSGTVNLSVNSTTSGYEMSDVVRSMPFKTYNLNHATSGTGTIFTDADNTWGDGLNYVEGSSTTAANGQTAGVDAHYGTQVSFDFFKNVLGRNGINGAGKAAYNRVHYSNNYDNAFWSDSCFCMTYGDGNSFTTLTALDVAAHEMSHGVCANSANLTYSGESGGLNESNSDIFGAVVEVYARNGNTLPATISNTNNAWKIGEQLASSPLRYMDKPSKDGASKDAWYSGLGSIDVHYSSGPNNRMFFFLSQGSGTTSGADNYSSYLPGGMTGIGMERAVRIWYRALTVYLTSSSNYAAARTACISSAKDLYGAGGAEEQAVWNAFAAINVGSKWSGGGTTDTTAPTVSASESGTSGTITFSATASDNVGVTKVEFYVDGILKGTDTTSPYAMTLDSTTLTNATHSLTAKAYDAAGNVATSAAVSFSVNNGGGGTTTERILNGGFESGATSWTQTSGVIGSYTSQPARTGSYNAWMCGYGTAKTEYVQQAVTIPSTATSATLTFWMHIDTAETTTTTAYDTMKVQVINGTTTTTLATYSNLNKVTGYVQKTFDLSAYKGKTVTLKFLGVEDSSLKTSFVIDDVSVKTN